MVKLLVTGTAVAVKVTVAPVATRVARSELDPGSGPSRQRVDASPVSAFELTSPPPLPPPESTVNRTRPAAALPYWSRTRTAGSIGRSRRTPPVWASPAAMTIVAGTSARASARSVTEGRPATLATSVLIPTVVPSFQFAGTAIPKEFVSLGVAPTVPPPEPTVYVTGTPASGFPNWLATITPGSVSGSLPT